MPRKGPSGWYSQAWMSRADQSLTSTTPKTCSREVVDRDPVAERGRHPDHEADLGFDVQAYRWPEGRTVRGGPLPDRPDHRRAGDHHGAGPAVIADRQVLPVGQQRRLAGPEDLAHIRRVVLGGVEVDVVGDLEREQQLDLGERDQQRFHRRAVFLGGEQLDDPVPDRRPLWAAERHELVQGRRAQRPAGQDQVGGLGAVEVEHEVADPYADPGFTLPGPEHPVRQVLHPVRRSRRAVHPAHAASVLR